MTLADLDAADRNRRGGLAGRLTAGVDGRIVVSSSMALRNSKG